jgi:hypothetical protein
MLVTGSSPPSQHFLHVRVDTADKLPAIQLSDGNQSRRPPNKVYVVLGIKNEPPSPQLMDNRGSYVCQKSTPTVSMPRFNPVKLFHLDILHLKSAPKKDQQIIIHIGKMECPKHRLLTKRRKVQPANRNVEQRQSPVLQQLVRQCLTRNAWM